ncbi:hypothetical protein [Pedobacter sp. SYSU D00535]|uniref:hypothetical protein n=1 Tax=Pedobacter sp. SYSU D00535 TaxID=2810308 RepID=UPI001A974EBD|nr:hypothetical protein [Pedobacter sp. SYSU D00535]
MKKLLVILGLLLSVSFYSNAQGQGGFQRRTPEESAKMQMERLPQTLNLNDDQKTKISAIFLNQAKSRDSLFTATGQGGDREAMRAKMMAITNANDEKVRALLNDEQKKIYNTYVEERATRMRNGQRPQGNR